MVDSTALRVLTIADDRYSPAGSEDRSRGPLLYSDPFRHAKEEPISNPWTPRWNFSATQMAAPALSLSSPPDTRFVGRRHESSIAAGRRQPYDHPDGFSRYFQVGHDYALFAGNTVVNQMEKHDPMLPSVPSFGLDSNSKRSFSTVNQHGLTSPCTPSPKRQRTIPIRQGKLYASDTSSESRHQHPLQENEADLLLYLANSPRTSSSSSSSSSGGGGGERAKHASYVHSFSANYSYSGLQDF
ncbi:hypothetical protein KEM54_003932, partial [Ascosphaera aggregata]